MKFNYTKLFMTCAFMVMSFAIFAQPPADIPDPIDQVGDEDPPATPVNAKLLYLAIAAVAFAFYQIRIARQKAHQ